MHLIFFVCLKLVSKGCTSSSSYPLTVNTWEIDCRKTELKKSGLKVSLLISYVHEPIMHCFDIGNFELFINKY